MTAVWLVLTWLAPPVALLGFGHRYRNLSADSRRFFWGGVVGYVVAIVLVTATLVGPTVAWAPEANLRWSTILFAPVVLPPIGAVAFRLLDG